MFWMVRHAKQKCICKQMQLFSYSVWPSHCCFWLYSCTQYLCCNIAGLGPGDEAHSVEVFEELCGVCRGQGSLQDAPQQLSDLAELMHSYGFPTPGWREGEGPGRPDPLANAASGLEQVRCIDRPDPASQCCVWSETSKGT